MILEFLLVLCIIIIIALYMVILKPYLIYKKYVKLLP